MAFYLTLMMGGVNPSPVPKAVLDALTEVQVTTAASSASGFQLKFTLGKNSPISTNYLPSGFFDPTKRVVITITVNGTPHVLMDGVITQQDVTANSQPGQSTLTVTGSDLTVYMDFINLTGIPYPGMSLEVRVMAILAKYAVFGVIPMVIPSIVQVIKNPVKEVAVHQGTDLAYVNSLAHDSGHVFYIEPGPKPGMSIAYWGPEVRIGLPQPALSVDFGAATNVESMNFSYNGLSREQLYLTILEPNSKIPIPIPIPDIAPLKPPLAKNTAAILKTRKLSDVSKFDPAQAALLAIAGNSGSTDAISANGQLDVQRYGGVLRARRLVAVRGAGINYDGLYFVKSVTHNIKLGDYKQSFSLVRGGVGSTISEVRA
jgi:hypothetical protein